MFAAVSLLLSLLQGGPAPITVSAAISLTEALQEVAGAYQASGGGKVVFNFGGSNVLARQIANGAPADVFISADEAQMDVVATAGLIAPGSRVALLSNALVLVAGASSSLSGPEDLARADVRRVAIGDPAAVPAGTYARMYLERTGLWSRLQPKLVPTTNVRAALAAVENGSADAAFVYATDARRAPGLRIVATVSGPSAPRIVYPAAVVRSSRHPAQAAKFLEFIQLAPAGRIFERHGFLPARGR